MDFPYWIKVKNFNWTIEQGTELEIEKGSGVKEVVCYVNDGGVHVGVYSLLPGDYQIRLVGFNGNGDECCSAQFGLRINPAEQKEESEPSKYDKVIVLEIGHGGREFGASSYDGSINEHTLNITTAKFAEKTLKQLGYKNIIVTDDNSSLFDVGFKFAKVANVFCSIHHNAFNNDAQGAECLWSNRSWSIKNDETLANIIAARCANALGIRDRNFRDKARGLSILSGATRARFEGKDLNGLDAAVLAEGYFMDDKKVTDHFDWSMKYGVALAGGIDEFLSRGL